MRGKLLQILGALLLLSAVFAFLRLQVFIADHLSLPSWQAYAVGGPIIFILGVAGVATYSTGKKITAKAAAALAVRDPRPPVLYLRSFKDDSIAARGSQFVAAAGGAVGGILISLVGALTTEEEQLAKAVQEIGPLLTIGKPGEGLPELGASRVYVKDEEWQVRVRELMFNARLVILRAGETAGFWWEVERVGKEIAPEKIVFLLPYDSRQYESFRTKAEAVLPCRLPPYPGRSKSAIGSIRAVLFFESNWTPHVVLVKRSGQSVDWVREFKRSLEPVFNQLHVQWKKPSSNFVHGLWLILYFFIGIGLLVGIPWLLHGC